MQWPHGRADLPQSNAGVAIHNTQRVASGSKPDGTGLRGQINLTLQFAGLKIPYSNRPIVIGSCNSFSCRIDCDERRHAGNVYFGPHLARFQ